MKSVMTSQHSFATAPGYRIPRASFNRSHGYKTTFDSGDLVPILVDETLPGDTFNLRTTGFARMATPINPVMDNIFMDTFYFHVPLRLIWDNFQKMMGEQENPGDSIDYLVPKVDLTAACDAGSIGDYLGIPTQVTELEVTSLAGRAYQLIWNEWFRDQNLQDAIEIDKGDGPDDHELYTSAPLKRGKRHDYFTSCLPTPQKGDGISLPLQGEAPILGLATNSGLAVKDTMTFNVNETSGATSLTGWQVVDSNDNNGETNLYVEAQQPGEQLPNIRADLSNVTAATINDLRLSLATQEFLERDMRGGTRYTEIIRSHFGVVSDDARLQRPEYLGGGTSMVNINPVAQTSSTDAETPQGNLAAFGTCSFDGHGFTKSFTEHGIIIGLVNVRADLTYQQGLNKMFSRRERYDFYWPEFAHLGEQPVLNQELCAISNNVINNVVFGYQEAWADYRYKPSQVTGKFRSNTPGGGLDSWHLSQDFEAPPFLNESFIEDQPPIDRVIAVPSEPEFIIDLYHNFKCVRPIPLYSVPGLNTTRF